MDISINSAAERLQDELVKMVCRQTSYTYHEADDALTKHNNDYNVVIKEFMGIKEKMIEKRTTNQETYKVIRQFMDVGSHQYYNNGKK
jgi:hypothetical protein